jgi:hypothetical protein
MTTREAALVDRGLLIYELWAEQRIKPTDEGAALHLNQFFEALKQYPGHAEAFIRGLEDFQRNRKTS